MKAPEFPHKIIISEEKIAGRIIELGKRITLDYMNREPVAVGILKGSFLFFADLIRHIHLPIKTDFLSVSSYGDSMESSGNVRIKNDITLPVKGEDLLIIEDIVDTGTTSKFMIDYLKDKNPRSIKICTLLNKQDARYPINDFYIDYIGFNVPDKFLIGYGLDYKEKYRNLPYIASIEKDIFNRKE